MTQHCSKPARRRPAYSAIIGGVTKGIVTKYLADANGGSRRILRPDCRSGISRICWKIDSRANVRTDTQPPGHGSEPYLDFVVTDLDGMLAQLCGPGALGCGQGFRAARLQSNFAVLTSHVSARLGSPQENSAARLPSGFSRNAKNRLPGEFNCLPRSITAGWRSTIDGCSTFWRISGDQPKRRRPNVIFGNGLCKLRFERK